MRNRITHDKPIRFQLRRCRRKYHNTYVSDESGNEASCSSTVTVSDTISPVISCITTTLYLDESGTASVEASDSLSESSDACGIESITASQTEFDFTNLGSNEVEITVTDVNQNSSVCIATVNIADSNAPRISCQQRYNIP